MEGLSIVGLNFITNGSGTNQGLFIKNLCTKYSGENRTYATDVDVRVQNCRISGFKFGFLHFGRGLTVKNCLLSRIDYVFDIRYYPDPTASWVTTDPITHQYNYEEVNVKHPRKYNHRGINISNNKIHNFVYRFLITRKYSYDEYHNDCDSFAYGMRICDNFIDNGSGVFILAQATAYHWMVCNNTINRIKLNDDDILINFKEGAKNTIVSDNNIHGALDYWQLLPPYEGIGIFLRCNGSENCSISNNTIDSVHNCIVAFGENKNLSVIGNNAKNVYLSFFRTVSVSSGRSFDGLLLTNNNVAFSNEITNTPLFLRQPNPSSEAVSCTNSYEEKNTWINGYKSQRVGDWVFVNPVVNYTANPNAVRSREEIETAIRAETIEEEAWLRRLEEAEGREDPYPGIEFKQGD